MSDSNIQVVKDMFERFLSGDIPGIIDLLADDVYWDHRGPAGVPINHLYEGPEAVGEFFRALNEMEEATVFEPREFFGKGDRVVCVGFFRFKVHATNKEWESDFAMIVTVWNGRITHLRPIFNMGAEASACQA